MRLFAHFPQDDCVCPICGTNDDKPCFLMPIDGTERDHICQAQATHANCLSDRADQFRMNRDAGIVYARVANAKLTGQQKPENRNGIVKRIVRPCRHNRCWLVAGGHIAWCYECGAIRKLAPVKGETNAVAPVGCWVKPTGRGGKNPWTVRFDGPNTAKRKQI